MCYLRGGNNSLKPFPQQVTELTRKNAHIYRQIGEHVQTNSHIKLPQETPIFTNLDVTPPQSSQLNEKSARPHLELTTYRIN